MPSKYATTIALTVDLHAVYIHILSWIHGSKFPNDQQTDYSHDFSQSQSFIRDHLSSVRRDNPQ